MGTRSQPGRRWRWAFLAMGVLLLAIATWIGVARMRFEAEALRADGEITGLRESTSSNSDGEQSTTYCPEFRFTDAGGRVFDVEGRGCSRPAGYSVGERVVVLYRSGAPQDASLTGFTERWLAVVIVGFFGLILLGIGLALVVPALLSHRKARELSRSGRPISAQVMQVAPFNGFKINGRSPWRIHAQWRDQMTGLVHVFHSDNLWYDPTDYVGEEIRVMLDPQDATRYWMDVSGLPQLA